ncbi:hypothetical protein ATCC90586_001880 [Pythium insidiosum]|nr:hypothetical protein ATCC90586_001880 [Pythium insidiosum]
MEVKRTLIDKEFDRYVLSLPGIERHEAPLTAGAALEPLDAVKTTRKAHWEARVHHNALTPDHLRSATTKSSIVYYVNAAFQVIQLSTDRAHGVLAHPVFTFPNSSTRKENVTIRVAGKGLLLCNDGSGVVCLLKSEDPDRLDAKWSVAYTCTPLGDSASLLVDAKFNDATQRLDAIIAEPFEGSDTDVTFRLSVLSVVSGASGLTHSTFELGSVASLPSVASFYGSQVLLFIEGKFASELGGMTEAQPVPASHTTKRHHDESDIEMDADELLSKIPRAGIGYHGDISDIKHPHDLGLDLNKPLAERFLKSSVPFSSLDEPLHSTSAQAVTSPKSSHLEVPTPESILGGFEECDDMDPNAKAALLLIDMDQRIVVDRSDVNCRAFRYLAATGDHEATPALLFQHDVHGLVFSVSVEASRVLLRHVATFPAFGFVQASKQDKKFMTFARGAQFACIGEFEKRVFVYHGDGTSEELQRHVRKQNIVEIGEHQLLGLAVVGSTIVLLSPHHVFHLEVARARRQQDLAHHRTVKPSNKPQDGDSDTMALLNMRRMQPTAFATAKILSKTSRVGTAQHTPSTLRFTAAKTSLQMVPLHAFGSTRSFSSSPLPSVLTDEKVVAASPAENMTEVLDATTNAVDYASVADLGYSLSDVAIRALEAVHVTTGLPWWATIVATTFAIRTALLPVTIKSLRNSEKMKAFQPEMEKLRDEMEAAPVKDPESMAEFRKKYQALMKKHDVNPFVGFLTPLSQIPVFLSFFWGLQSISKYFPDYSTGGDFWFPDLSVADPTYALPVISSALMIASVEMGADAMPAGWGDKAKFGMRLFGVMLVPLTMNFSSGVLVYWVSSNTYTLAQTALFRVPFVRSALKLSPSAKTVQYVAAPGSASPFQAAVNRAKEGAAIKTHVHKPSKKKTTN